MNAGILIQDIRDMQNELDRTLDELGTRKLTDELTFRYELLRAINQVATTNLLVAKQIYLLPAKE